MVCAVSILRIRAGRTDGADEAAPGAPPHPLSHVLTGFTSDLLAFLVFSPSHFPAMPSNSPAAAEPPQTPDNDTANDVVRQRTLLINPPVTPSALRYRRHRIFNWSEMSWGGGERTDECCNQPFNGAEKCRVESVQVSTVWKQ